MKDNISNLKLKKDIKNNFNINLLKISKSKTGYSHESYRAVLNGRVVFLKISDSEIKLKSEEYAYKLACIVKIPTPKILYYLSNKEFKYKILIIDKAKGTTLNRSKLNTKQEIRVYFDMGFFLKKIHSIRLDGFGLLKLNKNDFIGNYKTWKEFILRQRLNYTKLLKHSIITRKQFKYIKDTFSTIEKIRPLPVFMHNDFHAVHIFIDKYKISGVIDFGSAGVGDARYDIAKSLYFLSPKRRDYFKKGYGKLAQDSIIEKYVLIIAVRKAIWTLERDIESRTHCIKKLQNILENNN